jgi:hypothetical protein
VSYARGVWELDVWPCIATLEDFFILCSCNSQDARTSLIGVYTLLDYVFPSSVLVASSSFSFPLALKTACCSHRLYSLQNLFLNGQQISFTSHFFQYKCLALLLMIAFKTLDEEFYSFRLEIPFQPHRIFKIRSEAHLNSLQGRKPHLFHLQQFSQRLIVKASFFKIAY